MNIGLRHTGRETARAAKVNTVCVVIMINMSVYLSNKIITVAVSFKQDHGSQHNSDL